MPNSLQGNVVAMQTIIGGMMLQPCNPTFLSARDAIIAADASYYKGANKCEILKGICQACHGKGKPAPSGAFTHRIREDGEIFSGEEGRETSSDTTPLASVAGSVRMRSTDSDRSVRATPKKARDASPPPQDDLWVVIKNLSQQVAAQQAEMDALRNALALQQKATANLEKILGNMASQAASTSEGDSDCSGCYSSQTGVKPDVPKVSLHTSAPKVELSSGLRLIYASGFPYAKPGDLRKAMQGARIRTSAVRDIRWISRQVVQLLVDADYVSAFTRIITSLDATIVKSFKAWIPRPEAADKDKLAAISSFAVKTVTTIQRSPDVKARNFFRSLLASIGGKTLEAATVEATKIRVQTPGFDISTLETVPKESLPVKKATEQEPAAPAVDSPSDMAAEITPAIQVDGVTPTVTPIADIEMSVSITYLRSILAPILGHQMEHVSKIDRRTTKYGARFRITVPEDRQRKYHPAPRAPKQANPLAYSAKLPTSPSRPASTNSPTSTTITADPRSQCCQYQQQTSCYSPYRQEHQALGHLRDLHHFLKFRFTVPGFDVIQHPATGPGRRGIALGIPSCFGGHEHGSAVGTMILAKVPNFTPECLWIVGSVYVGHSGATTNYSRREAFASIRQALDRVVPFDNNHPVLIFGDWNTDPQRLQRIVHSWGHGLTVMQFSGSQITRLSTVHGRRHSSIRPLFQCNTLRDEWSRLKAAATQLERVDGRKQWVKHADNLDRAVSDGRTDLVFAAARAMSGNSSRSAAVTPLYNSDGIVQYDPTSILRVMQGHYGSLAADTTGHSLDLQYWHDRQPIQVSPNTPTIRNSDILDQDFSWNQIAAALLQMSPRKAPGDDGITTAFYQAALYMPANTQEGVPPTHLLSYEQAGFRKREECVGQVVSLVDIIQRRQNAGLNTHVLFIDIRKAFDTVPVGALLWKLQNMGFPRRTLAFLKALYTSSSARARAGSLLSDPFPVQRGVRQGCPLSGLLFNCSSTTFSMVSHPSQSLDYRETQPHPRTHWSWAKPTYGLELVGGNKSHLAPLQTTINKGIRLFTGARLSTAIGPLLVETGIGSLLTRSLVSRLVRSQRWFWSRRTKQLYRNRYWLTPQVRPKTVKQRHSFALMETLRTCGDSASLQKYVTRQLLDTSGFFKDPSFDQSRAHGTRYLMLARMDALWTARKAIQIGILVDTHPFSVDHCILCDQQLLSTSIAHLVVECEQVTGHRIQSGLVPAIQKSRLRLLGRALDPGVENVYTWLRGGVLNGEADLDQRWLDGTVEHESMGTRHDNRALAARLADFLQASHGKGKPAPSGAFTHRIREDGEVFSSEEGRETSSDTTPLASVAGSVRMRSTDSDRSVRATPKKARDASPPPQDDLWVVVKNLSQQVAAQQAEMDALRNTIALQQKATANLEKILSNMASQAASTIADIDYPPLPPTGATSKRKTVATKPNTTTTTATTTTTTTTGQPSKDTRFADAVKRRPTHQQLVERQPDFRKAGAAAWLALKRETSVPAHSAPKVELSSGLRIIYASGFPYAKPGDLRKAMQGARIRTSAVRDIRWISRQVVQLLVDADYVSAFTRIITSLEATIVKSFKAWIPRSEAAEKDKLAAISSFAVKTVTTIQRSPDVKARNFFRSLLASIGGKTLEAATAEATKIRVQTPDF
ncbi:hypothetical protein BASA83_001383 [Batrachochytrium salamandrivorans]|nr:hypothetical protein BASA83_001383 [Batrachochytrium salamandrivorans]